VISGVQEVDAQPITGSLLIRYDENILAEDQLLSQLKPYCCDSQAQPKKLSQPLVPGRRFWRRSVNLAMIGSLGLSVYAAYRISKKTHVTLGFLFLAVSLEHLRLNRRRLLP
jgi:hypothetical protein